MTVFLNPYCDCGRGFAKWRTIEKQVKQESGQFDTVLFSPEPGTSQVEASVKLSESHLVVAGGDGTVNLVLNAVMQLPENRDITLGAVGLGSSNDFHKPVREHSTIEGIPTRIDFANTVLQDLIRVRFMDRHDNWKTRYGILNASIGITTEGNAYFSSGNKMLSVLRAISVNASILASAIVAIFRYRDLPVLLTVDHTEQYEVHLSNLGILKNPHFTGSLCYDTPIAPDDGKLGINLCYELGFTERVRMLMALANRHFRDLPKTCCWLAEHCSVDSDHNFALEIDGEVVQAGGANFTVLPKKVRCCR